MDGFEYPLPDLVSYKFYEVAKYLSLDGHTTDFFLIAINRTLWQGLSKEEQGMMAQALKTAMDWQWREQPGEIEKSLAKLKGLMQVNELSPADKALSRIGSSNRSMRTHSVLWNSMTRGRWEERDNKGVRIWQEHV